MVHTFTYFESLSTSRYVCLFCCNIGINHCSFKISLSIILKHNWYNTAGGWLILGVEQLGKTFNIVGVGNAEKLEQDLLNSLRSDKFNIKIVPQCEKYVFDGKTVLAFYISLSDKKPIYYGALANTFIRTGSGDQKATNTEIDAMFRDQAFGTRTNKLTKFTTDALYLPSVERYQDYLSRFNPSHRYNNLTQKELLQKLQLIDDGKLSYAGLLMFGQNDFIQKEFPDFRIDLLEIPGKSYRDAKVRYTYRLSEQENLWEYYFTLFDRLKLKINIPFKMNTQGFAIDESPAIDAIREALVNLLMHADYFSPAKSRIRIFEDRIEFFNPGGLPLSIEKLLETDSSIPRNPILASAFRAVRLAENAGFGFDKMIDGWEAYNKSKPIIYSDLTSTIMTFRFSDTDVGKGVGKDVGKDLTELQFSILIKMQKNSFVTIDELAKDLETTTRTVERNIEKLKNLKKIARIGGRKEGYWEVNQ